MTCNAQTKTCTTRGLTLASKVAALGKGGTEKPMRFGGELRDEAA